MKHIFFKVVAGLVLFVPCVSTAQKVRVVSEDEISIPYLYFVSFDKKTYLLSDSEGIIDLSHVSVPDTMKFTASSDFYSSEAVTFMSLKSMSKLVVHSSSISLDDIYVMPQENLLLLLKKTADKFSKNYLKNYVAKANYSRIIYSGSNIQQLYLINGLWSSFGFNQKSGGKMWDDRNLMGGFLALDSFVTDFLIPGTRTAVNTYEVVDQSLGGLSCFDVNYVNIFNLQLLDIKRSIEIYSPLSTRHIEDYSYKLKSVFKKNGEEVYNIIFTTKQGRFPNHTKLLGSGEMSITKEGDILSLSVENMEDRFSTYMLQKYPAPSVMLTPYKWTVNYAQIKGGIVTSSVNMSVNWKLPENATSSDNTPFYNIEWNVYRKPFKNRLRTETEVVFKDFVAVTDKKTLNTLMKYFRPTFGAASNYFAVKDPNKEYWRKRIKSLSFASKVLTDLYAENFDELFVRVELRNTKNYDEYLGNKEKNQDSRMLYKYLYGKEYYE